MTGIKHDGEKPRWDLLPLSTLEGAVRVLTFGAGKYSPDNWTHVPDPVRRYYAAMMRHLTAWQSGELVDPETGERHLDHAICCLLFLRWHDERARSVQARPPVEI